MWVFVLLKISTLRQKTCHFRLKMAQQRLFLHCSDAMSFSPLLFISNKLKARGDNSQAHTQIHINFLWLLETLSICTKCTYIEQILLLGRWRLKDSAVVRKVICMKANGSLDNYIRRLRKWSKSAVSVSEIVSFFGRTKAIDEKNGDGSSSRNEVVAFPFLWIY